MATKPHNHNFEELFFSVQKIRFLLSCPNFGQECPNLEHITLQYSK